MSRTHDEQDGSPTIGVPVHPSSDGPGHPRSWWRSAGRAVVRVVYDAVFDHDLAAHRPPPRRLAPDPDAHSDAERIADLLRIRRRSAPWLLGIAAIWTIGTGAAAIVGAWGEPPWAWIAVAGGASLGAAIGASAVSRSLPSVDDGIARLRAHRFRPPVVTERPSTRAMLASFAVVGLALLPMADVLVGGAQSAAWALSAGVFGAGGLAMHRRGRRTAAALAGLPEAQSAGAEGQSAGAEELTGDA